MSPKLSDDVFEVEEDKDVTDGDPTGPEGATEYHFKQGEQVSLQLAQELGLKGAGKPEKSDSGK